MVARTYFEEMVCPRSRSERPRNGAAKGRPECPVGCAQSLVPVGIERPSLLRPASLSGEKFNLGIICSAVNYWSSGIYDQNESGLSQVNEISWLLELISRRWSVPDRVANARDRPPVIILKSSYAPPQTILL